MAKSDFFNNELDMITDSQLKEITKRYFDDIVPQYFWQSGASSTGKYHPAFSQGEGGLARHTRAVVMFAVELMRLEQFNFTDDEQNFVIVACLIHDTAKYGTGNELDKSQFNVHGELAASAFETFAKYFYDVEIDKRLLSAVETHMGQWGNIKPSTAIENCVHLADYMASRNFIDIPNIY